MKTLLSVSVSLLLITGGLAEIKDSTPIPVSGQSWARLKRSVDVFNQYSKAEWGCKTQQLDQFIILHPKNEVKGKKYPLYVVFHSAGHSVTSALACTPQQGNHDVYRTPGNMYGLYVDCRANSKTDWWWGSPGSAGRPAPGGTALEPVEKRVIATILWVMEKYPIDRNRVYAGGNSMGGSGTLGFAINHGDIFAAARANVPAGVNHVLARMGAANPPPKGFRLPDPPVIVDYSGQNDHWSRGHEKFYAAMKAEKYAVVGYWGWFGHANNDRIMQAQNDLIHSLNIFDIVRNEAYPVFTNASTDSVLPWPACTDKTPGQINAFFRWKNRKDSADKFEIELRLMNEKEWKTRIKLPESSTADVSLRRLQRFSVRPGEKVNWKFGKQSGTVATGADGVLTIPELTITKKPQTLFLEK